MKTQRKFLIIGFLLSIFIFYLQLHSAEIVLYVEEPLGISRINYPITSGIPMPYEGELNNWALFSEDNNEIPIQMTRLSGKTPWILLDLQVDISGNENKTYYLRDTSPRQVQHPNPITIDENIDQINVHNGILKAVIDKKTFRLFEGIWFDQDGDHVYDEDEIIVEPNDQNLNIIDAISEETFNANNMTQTFSWEYKGPIRSTLRIDGDYLNSSDEKFLSFTTRIHFYAGQTFFKIEHILRNSLQFNERHVKVNSATLTFGDGGEIVRSLGPGSVSWANLNSSGLTFEMIPENIWGIDTDSNNGIIIPDLSHFQVEIVIDLDTEISDDERLNRIEASQYPLLALASSSYYSKYGELTTTGFASLQDEKDTYNNWSWTWTEDEEPYVAHDPDFKVSWKSVDVHGDSESDDLWQNLIMYLRTANKDYFYRARAWARYYKYEYVLRTDGFDYAWDNSWEPTQVSRTPIEIPLTNTDSEYLHADVGHGRIDFREWSGCHTYGWGLIDYYYLTGDLDALQAASDIAEIIERKYLHREASSYDISSSPIRTGARHLLLITSLWEATMESRWEILMNHIADLWLQASRWDDRGFYYNNDDAVRSQLGNNAVGKAKGFPPYHMGILSHAFERYYKNTKNVLVKNRLIAMADWVFNYGVDSNYEYTGSFVGMDFPDPGDYFHNYFMDEPVTFYDPTMTVSLIDVLVRGFRYSGEKKYLERAKYHWNRGSKGRYGDVTIRIAGEDEVGRFLNNRYTTDRIYFNHNKGDLSYAHLIFYENNNPSSLKDVTPMLKEYNLYQNFPNPFNPTTTISYFIPQSTNVELELFDVLGKKVAVLDSGFRKSGFYTISFNAKKLAGSIYFYRLITDEFQANKKMIIIK